MIMKIDVEIPRNYAYLLSNLNWMTKSFAEAWQLIVG